MTATGRALTLPRPHPRPMIDLGNIAGPHQRGHDLAAYCPKCERWRVLPLAHLVANGKGSLRLPVKVRCKDRGEVGRLQVRPPVSSAPRPTGGSARAAGSASNLSTSLRTSAAPPGAALPLGRVAAS